MVREFCTFDQGDSASGEFGMFFIGFWTRKCQIKQIKNGVKVGYVVKLRAVEAVQSGFQWL
jgi:hypothetical protein